MHSPAVAPQARKPDDLTLRSLLVVALTAVLSGDAAALALERGRDVSANVYPIAVRCAEASPHR